MHKRYTRVLLVVFAFMFLNKTFVSADSSKETTIIKQGKGPMGIYNQMPLYLLYLQLRPDRAEVIEKGKFSVDADYTVSNITVSAFTPATSFYQVEIDLEVSRINLDFLYGLYDNLEIGLELPYISFSRGYLDDFIEGIEDGIGAKTPRSRERQGSYEFEYSFKYKNKYLIKKEQSVHGIGDIALNAKYQLLKERDFCPNLSLRAAIKFPTAEKKDLLGSGETDYGIGLLIDKEVFNRVFIYAAANVIKIEKPDFFSELGLDKEIYSGMMAVEYFLSRRFSIVTQVSGNTTPYPYSNTNPLDNNAYELCLGFNYTWEEKEDTSWHFAIVENIQAASTPDVTFQTGISYKF